MKKLVLAGIIFIAAGLIVMASYDPLVRVLVMGPPTTSFPSGSGSGNRVICSSPGSCTTVTGTGTGGFQSGSTTPVRFSGGSGELLYVVVGYAAAIVGLIFVIVGELAGGPRGEKKTEAAPSAVR